MIQALLVFKLQLTSHLDNGIQNSKSNQYDKFGAFGRISTKVSLTPLTIPPICTYIRGSHNVVVINTCISKYRSITSDIILLLKLML